MENILYNIGCYDLHQPEFYLKGYMFFSSKEEHNTFFKLVGDTAKSTSVRPYEYHHISTCNDRKPTSTTSGIFNLAETCMEKYTGNIMETVLVLNGLGMDGNIIVRKRITIRKDNQVERLFDEFKIVEYSEVEREVNEFKEKIDYFSNKFDMKIGVPATFSKWENSFDYRKNII